MVKCDGISGYKEKQYKTRRDTEENLLNDLKKLKRIFRKIVSGIPSLSVFFETGHVDRNQAVTSLLFRPIGQLIFFTVYKIASDRNRKKDALAFFKKDNFNLNNDIWRRVFIDEDTGSLKTEKPLQKFAAQLILKHLDIDFSFTKKERVIYTKFDIAPDSIG